MSHVQPSSISSKKFISSGNNLVYINHSEKSSPGTLSLPHHTIISFLQNFINKHFRHPIFLGLKYFPVFPQETFHFPWEIIYRPSNLILSRKPNFGVTSSEFPWDIILHLRNLFIFICGGWKTQLFLIFHMTFCWPLKHFFCFYDKIKMLKFSGKIVSWRRGWIWRMYDLPAIFNRWWWCKI